jgi:CRP-like cAMP-binding protein
LQELRNQITKISPLTPPVMELMLEAWKPIPAAKDKFLLNENTISDYIYFVRKGVIRIFYLKNGKEITEWLATDNQFFLSISSFFQRTPSKLMIQTIESSEVSGIHFDDLMELADKYHEVERFLRKTVTYSLILSQNRMESIQFETAQQRYERLIRQFPEIIRRVPLSHIASFLGITAETLSRIRSIR